jgi:N-acyl-D-aspartate/D-glutamate deacylase
VLGHYTRDLGLFPLETAVHKMTALSTRRFNLEERGELRAGFYADVTVFDAATISDAATFAQPAVAARGICYVLVNGVLTYVDGNATMQRGGRFLSRVHG